MVLNRGQPRRDNAGSVTRVFMGIQITVIVPTCNRKDFLTKLLSSLFQQTLPPDQYEVVVVSDGSTDGTGDLVRALQEQHPNLVLLEQRNQGPAAARNAGARVARGEYLAFTDDDCIASRDWLERTSRVFERTGAGVVQGRTSTDREARSPLTNQVDNERGMYGVPTCNAAYRKGIFSAVGGFDERFPFPHNEDADLAWRAERLGPVVFAPEVHIIHPPRRETLWGRAYWVRYLESDFLLYAKHPEAYRQRCSASPWHTIYWRAFVVAQFGGLKSSVKYLVRPFKPRYFFQGNALVLVRWWNLIRFYPFYLRAARRHRRASVKHSSQPQLAVPGVLAKIGTGLNAEETAARGTGSEQKEAGST